MYWREPIRGQRPRIPISSLIHSFECWIHLETPSCCKTNGSSMVPIGSMFSGREMLQTIQTTTCRSIAQVQSPLLVKVLVASYRSWRRFRIHDEGVLDLFFPLSGEKSEECQDGLESRREKKKGMTLAKSRQKNAGLGINGFTNSKDQWKSKHDGVQGSSGASQSRHHTSPKDEFFRDGSLFFFFFFFPKKRDLEVVTKWRFVSNILFDSVRSFQLTPFFLSFSLPQCSSWSRSIVSNHSNEIAIVVSTGTVVRHQGTSSTMDLGTI